MLSVNKCMTKYIECDKKKKKKKVGSLLLIVLFIESPVLVLKVYSDTGEMCKQLVKYLKFESRK